MAGSVVAVPILVVGERAPAGAEGTGGRRMGYQRDVVIVGGCGHVGFPLGLAFADRGLSVALFDIDKEKVAGVNAGRVPADEPGAQSVLDRVAGTTLEATDDPAVISTAEHVVIVIGTPVGAHLGPDPQAVPTAIEDLADHFRDGQLLVLRSTVYPGVTASVERIIERELPGVEVAFCPERIAEGRAMTELFELPQLVAARNPHALERASRLFGVIAPKVVTLSPEEAELAKLFTNVYRYIKFAAANQLYMIANDFGLDFERVRHAITADYPRAADMPGAGFAAGPCLFKDTMQLAAFNNNNFTLGHSSMMVNEGLPLYLVARLEQRFDLSAMTVGILGMAFKAESDDIRSSLSYKLKRILRYKAARVLCTDPYVTTDPDLVGLDEVLGEADLLIVGTPHRAYRDVSVDVPVADIWNVMSAGVRV
jgi:UDP-N-acetyl-D-mannosaminuronic acid dehydrogenase